MMASAAAVALVLVVSTQDADSVLEANAPLRAYGQPGPASPNMRMQISQQLQRYDMAIKRVDDGIAQTKLNLVAQSQKLGQATQLAEKLRAQLAAKQSVVFAERQRLQVDALQLAAIEQNARKLLSPRYTPDQKELQVAAQETNLAPPPPLSLVQTGPQNPKAAANH